MIDGHNLEGEQAQIMRDLTIRLLFETDPEKQEALVAQLAIIVKAQRDKPRVA